MRLGRDELKPAAPFVRIFSKSDIQEVTGKIIDLIPEYYGGIDFLNPVLYRRLGFFELSESNPVLIFLKRLILEQKKLRKPLTEKTRGIYTNILKQKYGYSDNALSDYIRAYMELKSAGEIPEAVLHPYDYTPTTVTGDIGKVLSSKLGLYLLAGVAIWGLSTTFIPQVTDAVTGK